MVGDVLKKYRKRRKLSQSALAKIIGVNQATLSRWERNEVPVPPERLKQLGDELGIEKSDLKRMAFESSPYAFDLGVENPLPPPPTGHVTDNAGLDAWTTRVIADGPDDPNLKLLLFVLQNYIDKTSWVVSGTIPQIAASASLPVGMVEDLWADLLESPFVERVGSGEWTLRLVVPGEGAER